MAHPYKKNHPSLLLSHNSLANSNHNISSEKTFWRNLVSRVSKWFDSAKNMLHHFISPMVNRVQESFSSAMAKLRGFFVAIITKLRNFFVAAYSMLCDFVVTIATKIRSFFNTVVANVRNFFSAVTTLYRVIQKMQKLLYLLNALLDILDSEMALQSKLLQVLKIFNQSGVLGTIFGRMVQN